MKLIRRKFIANIGVPENTSSGLILLSTDPREQEQKPDVFVGEVEEIADDCKWVKVGDKVAFVRFDYGTQSADVGENRVIVDEQKDVLILGEDKAAPGVIAVNVIEEQSGIEIPDWVKMNNETPNLIGQVIASGWSCEDVCKYQLGGCKKEHVEVNDIIVFRRMSDSQFRLGKNTIIFNNLCRHCRDHAKMDCAADIILAIMHEVHVPKMLLEVV